MSSLAAHNTAPEQERFFYVAWRSPEGPRRYHVIARVDLAPNRYRFRYTHGLQGARKDGLNSLMAFPKEHQVYETKSPFPLLSNRLMNTSRPNYKEYLEGIGLPTDVMPSAADELSRTGGHRMTDHIHLFEAPMREGDELLLRFAMHGTRHMGNTAISTARTLEPGTELFLMHDWQNSHDAQALALRQEGTATLLGYVPRYHCGGIHRLRAAGHTMRTKVIYPVPLGDPYGVRVVCELRAPWLENFAAPEWAIAP